MRELLIARAKKVPPATTIIEHLCDENHACERKGLPYSSIMPGAIREAGRNSASYIVTCWTLPATMRCAGV